MLSRDFMLSDSQRIFERRMKLDTTMHPSHEVGMNEIDRIVMTVALAILNPGACLCSSLSTGS